jgi:hypothetical protein
MARSKRSKTWCFTLNNYTVEEEAAIAELEWELRYVCYGKEVGEGGTAHLQGYLELKSRRPRGVVKRSISWLARSHLEPRRGSQQQAIDYCAKDGDFHEFGDKQRPGRRTDLEHVRAAIDNGATMAEISSNHFAIYLQYGKGLQAYRNLHSSPRKWKSHVRVLWGRTGTGKTRWVYHFLGDRALFKYPGTDTTSIWFDGYDGHEVVLFDDFRGDKTMPFDLLLRLLDRYPMDVPIKGGFVSWKPRKIWITSNTAPNDWYASTECAPLWRRIEYCRFVDDPLFDDIVEERSYDRLDLYNI